MRRIAFVLIATALTGSIASMAGGTGRAAQETAPIFVKQIPAGYRDGKVVSVAHEAGDLNDIRAVLGNDIAIKAYRAGKLPFPEGAVVGRIAWSYVASEENNKIFGREQSFVAGAPTDTYLQFMVKDSKKYAATGGWGYSSFDKDGTPTADVDDELLPLPPGYQESRLHLQPVHTLIRSRRVHTHIAALAYCRSSCGAACDV